MHEKFASKLQIIINTYWRVRYLKNLNNIYYCCHLCYGCYPFKCRMWNNLSTRTQYMKIRSSGRNESELHFDMTGVAISAKEKRSALHWITSSSISTWEGDDFNINVGKTVLAESGQYGHATCMLFKYFRLHKSQNRFLNKLIMTSNLHAKIRGCHFALLITRIRAAAAWKW
jgi:hypothetical protein